MLVIATMRRGGTKLSLLIPQKCWQQPIFIIDASINKLVTESTTAERGLSVSTIGEVIGIFALAGIGIGATGGVAVNLLGTGSGIVSGILVLVVLTVTFLLGPVIGLISGLRVGDRQGRSSESYLGGLLGSVAGYFIMILAVILIISAVMTIGGGGGSETATTQTATGGSSSGLPIGEYIVPIIAVALPTGITGLGGAYFGGSADTAQGGGIKLPKKYIAGTIIILIILAAGTTVVPDLLSSEPQLEVDGTTEFSDNAIYADTVITNPTDGDVTNTLAVELVINGDVVQTDSEQVTVAANDDRRDSLQLIEETELTQSQTDAINQGNMELRFRINNQVVDTHSPDAILDVDGTTEFSDNAIYADIAATNPTDSEITNTLTVELVINGDVVQTDSGQITVAANDGRSDSLRLIEGTELTRSQIDAVNQGNMELRFIINGQVVDTDSPAAS
jgi:hypothetical protein